METCVVIPARGGSKGIPRKNIMDFCGHPLISWSISAALQCPKINSVFVSTDDREIAEVARHYGADIIWRPAELATDKASSETALIHACEELGRRSLRPQTLVFLQATSPLRETRELTEALQKFREGGYDSLFCAAEPEDFLMWREENGCLESLNYDFRNRKRRQEGGLAGRLLVETGSFYISNVAGLLEHRNRLFGKIGYWTVEFWKSMEIDSLEGAVLCAALMRAHELAKNAPQCK